MHRPSPGPLRRFAAMGYDALLLAAVLFIAALPLPLLSPELRATNWGRVTVQIYLLVISFGFYGWFWVHGGQTLGLRAWRMRLVGDGEGPVTWMGALKRFVAALLSWVPLGLGFIWILVDREGLAWHDRLSRTRLILVPKNPKD